MTKSIVTSTIKRHRSRNQRTANRLIRGKRFIPPKKETLDFGFPTDFRYFRKMIGNPISKITGLQQDMAPFQIDYHSAIKFWHWVLVLKSRKLGATETANTSIALNSFDRYVGHDTMIVAGNELRIAKEVLLRIHELFEDKQHEDGMYAFKMLEPEFIPQIERGDITFEQAHAKGTKIHYADLIKNARLAQDPVIEFKNGARIFAFAASKQEKSQTFRGPDDVICIFLTEAAATGMKQDQPIMNALEPNLAQRDDADFILESTGNGRRGFYYDYWMMMMEILSKEFKIPVTNHQQIVDQLHYLWKKGKKMPRELDWFPCMWDYKVGLDANIISKKFIEKEKRNPKIDFAQEYMCKFTSSYSSAIDTSNIKFKDPNEPGYEKSIDLLEMIGKK